MAVLALFGSVLVAVVPGAAAAHADVTTVSNDNQRTGWDQNEPNLSPGAVAGTDFGQLFSTPLTGQIYAQPLVVGSTVIVGTEENDVYALDSETGAVKWQRNLGPSWPASTVGCGDLVPDIGITSTPVYDPSSGYVYLTAKVNDGATAATPHYYLYALNAADGTVVPGWPVTIGGSPSNDPSTSFNAETQLQRPGILLQNGSVYLGFGGHCDYQPYRGYVVGVNLSTKAQHLWTTEAGAGASGSGIWQAGGGLVTDGGTGIFVATGNGVTPPVGPGTSPPTTLSESLIHLAVGSDGTISAADFFSPANAATLDKNDQDLASGGPVALPDAEFGTPTTPHLLTVIGKDGRLFLLNRDNLGGRGQGAGGTDQIVGQTQLSGVWGHPAVWGGDGGYLYVAEDYQKLVAVHYGLTGTGVPSFSLAGTSTQTMGYTSGSPVVTSTGTTSGSALVWVVQSSGPTGANGQLLVYNAVPSNNAMTLIRSWPLGTVSKFSVPATNNGRVYVGTRDGNLIAFGAPTTQPLTGSPANLGSVQVGSTGTGSVTLTAARTVSVSAVSAAAPFAVDPSYTPPTAPLTAGQTLTVPVDFTPTTWGSVTGTLALTTDQGTVDIGLNGTGTQAGLASSPATLDWGEMAVGSSETLTVGVTNTSTATETFQSVSGATGPFTSSGLPAVGSTIAPGVSETLSVTYAPTAAENDTSSIGLTTDQGTLTIPLTGVGIAAAPQVTISPMSLAFGNVLLGTSVTKTFTVADTGNVNLTVTKAAPSTAPFNAINPIPESQQLAPGESYTVSITFTPTVAGAVTGSYEVSTDTGQGPMYITMTGTGTVNTLTPPGGGWTVNGSATTSGTNLNLSALKANQAGSAVYGAAVPSRSLQASFTAQLGGGTGGTGMTFSLLDATTATATSLGGNGGGMGFSGLSGVSVVLSTYQQPGAPSNNFVGIATGGTGGTLTYLAVSRSIGALRTGTHTVSVMVTTAGRLDVSIDGKMIMSPLVTVPASVFPAFTAATGTTYDNHTVSGVKIWAGKVLPVPGGGWSYNGTASMVGHNSMLTPAVTGAAGSVVYPTPITVNNLAAKFMTVINSGTGADGLTFSLLDASKTTATSLGAHGGGFGVTGLPGVYVIFNTYTGGKEASSVSIGTNPASGSSPTLHYTANVPSLRNGHTVNVTYSAGVLSVSVDGTQVLQGAVTLPATVLPAFTGGTGALTDGHFVGYVTMQYY